MNIHGNGINDHGINNSINTHKIASIISAKVVGPNNDFTGIFTFLGEAKSGDIVIRHWINEKAIELAKKKNLAGIITSDPRGNSCDLAKELEVCLIVLDKIEIANAFALNWTIGNFAYDSKRVAITGTNGKSTVSHMLYHILNYNNGVMPSNGNNNYNLDNNKNDDNGNNNNFDKSNSKNIYTNTDAKSEFNTLIDPMISKQISNLDYAPDYLVIEVSEVQGWLGDLMENHASLMANAIIPDVGIITNIYLDHIGLVNSIDEVFNEVFTFAKSFDNINSNNINDNVSIANNTHINNNINNNNSSKTLVLNYDDKLVRKIASFTNNSNIFFFTMNNNDNTITDAIANFNSNNDNNNNSRNGFIDFIIYNNGNITYNSKNIINLDDLPFKSNHFIQNTLAAIAGAISLDIPIENIVAALKTYNSLNRRFKIINKNPLIIDDFAHNPEGIKATINAAYNYIGNNEYKNGSFFVVCSIRGSRGLEINKMNAQAIVDAFISLNNSNNSNEFNNINSSNISLIITNSSDFVDNLNTVTKEEENVFLATLNSVNSDNNSNCNNTYNIKTNNKTNYSNINKTHNNTNNNKNCNNYLFYDKLEDALDVALDLANNNDVILLIGSQGMDPAEELLKSNYLN